MFEAGASSGLMAALFTGGIALPHIAASGNADLVDRFVRPTLAGEKIGALAITEPGGGSDVAAIRTTARGSRRLDHRGRVRRRRNEDLHHQRGPGRLRDRGGADRRTGRRRHLAARRREGHAGLHRRPVAGEDGLALLRHRRAGLRRRAACRWPTWSAPRAPGSRRSPSSSWWSGSRWPCTATALRSVAGPRRGVREGALDLRPAAGRPPGRPAPAGGDAARSTVARTYTPAIAARHVAGEDVIAEACLAKQTAVEAAVAVCDAAVQLHGGTGYLHGTEVERHYRDARILPIGGGATEVLTDLAARLLGYSS